MVVYIDLIITVNIIINIIMLISIQRIFADEIHFLRIVLASVIGSIFVLSIFINNYLYYLLKIFGGIIIICIGIKNIVFSKQIIKISLFYTLNLAFTGFLRTFRITNTPWILLFLGLILGLVILENNHKYFIFLKRNSYKIKITFFDKKYQLIGYLDTGNECLYNGIPIIFVNNKYKDMIQNRQSINEITNIYTVNGLSIQNIYKPQEFTIYINKKEYHKKVVIIFCDINKDCLINPYIFI